MSVARWVALIPDKMPHSNERNINKRSAPALKSAGVEKARFTLKRKEKKKSFSFRPPLVSVRSRMCRVRVFALFVRLGAFVRLAVIAATKRNRYQNHNIKRLILFFCFRLRRKRSCLRTLLFLTRKDLRSNTV